MTAELSTKKDIVILKGFTDKQGRWYHPKGVEVALISNTTYLGELGFGRSDKVDMERMSHAFKNVRRSDQGLVGDLVVLDTPMGRTLQSLLDEGVEITTSLRSLSMLAKSSIDDKIIVHVHSITAIDVVDMKTFDSQDNLVD